MAKNKLSLILIIIFLFIIPFVLSTGVCELNKNDLIPGEIATFKCQCSSSQEENRAGYIVYLQDNGTILFSTAISSGFCKSSIFGASYTFSKTFTNYTGTTIFSANADGTGDPPQWSNIDDRTSDTFTVNGSDITKCIIEYEIPTNSTPVFTVGKHAALSIKVKDGNTFSKIVGARCTLHLESVNDIHILNEPYNPPINYVFTTANGEASFERQWDTDIIETDTTYLIRTYCYCPGNESDTPCYYQDTGELSPFKACTADLIISSSSEDFRRINNGYLTGIILMYILLVIFYAGFGIHTYQKSYVDLTRFDYWLSFLCLSLSALMLLSCIGVAYGYYIGTDMSDIINITFISNAIIILLGGTLLLIRHYIGMSAFMDPKQRKWDKGKWL